MKVRDRIGKALGRVPSGLFIVTARYEDRQDAVLASWVNQCSFEPPAVTIALAKTRPARLLVEASQSFIVNVLNKDPNGLLKRFCKAPADPNASVFEGLEVQEGFKGITVLKDAVSYLECEVVDQRPVGDHVVYFGKIVGGGILQGGEPYVHVRTNGFSY
ncbi:MAG: flavin reductase family protein [Nitrospinae bacterium]|nr:flavin reductase family protein [Nitrospinota bacterium]